MLIGKMPPIYPIIDDSMVPFGRLCETAEAIIGGGAEILQFRSKNLTPADLLAVSMELRRMTEDSKVLFIVNDRVDIALLSSADGVHLGQEDLPVAEARRLLGDERIIGLSTHSVKEAMEAGGLPVDYISFGPVYRTATKTDARSPRGLRELTTVRGQVGLPVVAIGGIRENNCRLVLEAGADSVAMISDILSEAGIREKLARLTGRSLS